MKKKITLTLSTLLLTATPLVTVACGQEQQTYIPFATFFRENYDSLFNIDSEGYYTFNWDAYPEDRRTNFYGVSSELILPYTDFTTNEFHEELSYPKMRGKITLPESYTSMVYKDSDENKFLEGFSPMSIFRDKYTDDELNAETLYGINILEVGDHSMSNYPLMNIDLPKVKKIGNYVNSYESEWENIGPLRTVSFPEVEEIGEWSFSRTSIETLSLPKLKKLGRYAFSEINIEYLLLPELEELGGWHQFGENNQQGNQLVSFRAPKLKLINGKDVTSRQAANTLTEVYIPSLIQTDTPTSATQSVFYIKNASTTNITLNSALRDNKAAKDWLFGEGKYSNATFTYVD